MAKQDIIVIGASAGGVSALRELIHSLPADFKGSVFVVLHIPASSPSHLPEILSNAGSLEAVHPADGEPIKQGKIYVAPPDHHLLIEKGKILVKVGPKENRFRPSIDALFRSAAYTYGPRVTGIVLSGVLNDGTSGMWSIKRMGGTCIVQDPGEAEHPEMPVNVTEYVDVDHILPAGMIGELLYRLSKKAAPLKPKIPAEEKKLMEMEVHIAITNNAFEMGIMNMGRLTPFTCPECYGALIQLKGDIMRYRCHTGHAFTASALLSGISENIESTMWQSMRALEEGTMLLKNMAKHFKALNHKEAAALFLEQAKNSSDQARIMHDSVFRQRQLSEDIRFKSLQLSEKKRRKK